MYLGPTREPTKEEIEAIAKGFEKAANPANGWCPPCPAIDMKAYQRQEAIEHAMHMGGSGIDHFRQTMDGIYRLVSYRAEVAKQLKKAGSDGEAKALDELFDYCNNQLKDYLAIV